MLKYLFTAALLPFVLVNADDKDDSCEVYTYTATGDYVWSPESQDWPNWAGATGDPTWAEWSATTDDPTGASTWSDWVDPTATSTWADWSDTTDDPTGASSWPNHNKVKPTGTSDDPQPAGWGDWQTAATVDPDATSTWEDWQGTTTGKAKDPAKTGAGWDEWNAGQAGAKSTGYPGGQTTEGHHGYHNDSDYATSTTWYSSGTTSWYSTSSSTTTTSSASTTTTTSAGLTPLTAGQGIYVYVNGFGGVSGYLSWNGHNFVLVSSTGQATVFIPDSNGQILDGSLYAGLPASITNPLNLLNSPAAGIWALNSLGNLVYVPSDGFCVETGIVYIYYGQPPSGCQGVTLTIQPAGTTTSSTTSSSTSTATTTSSSTLSTTVTTTTTASTSTTSGPCTSPSSLCGPNCINTNTDSTNCGACGNACPAGRTCVNGVCGCANGGSLCGNNCVTLSTDNANCGACGTTCGPLQTCVNGVCSCPTGQNACENDCVNFATDRLNCGACGNVCGAEQSCNNGVCTCPQGQNACGANCVTFATDNANCGSCGNVCSATQTCTNGVCSCPTGQSLCGTGCFNLLTDNANCGACGTTCGPAQTCTNGACTCPAGQTVCGQNCVQPAQDDNNCGTCGTVCPAGQHCIKGVCEIGNYCTTPFTCGGTITPCSAGIGTGACDCYGVDQPNIPGLCIFPEDCSRPLCQTTADCPNGDVCTHATCCGFGICIPFADAQCPAGAGKLLRRGPGGPDFKKLGRRLGVMSTTLGAGVNGMCEEGKCDETH